MLGQPGKGEIKLICDEVRLPEFPDLKFGQDKESGKTYFNATAFLNANKERSLNVQAFLSQAKPFILNLCQVYSIDWEEVHKIGTGGQHLIEDTFVYLFICFVQPQFLAHVCDRIHEIFTQGFSVSDSYLASQARYRFTGEVLVSLASDEQTEQ